MNYLVLLNNKYESEILIKDVQDISETDNFIHFFGKDYKVISAFNKDHIIYYKQINEEELKAWCNVY